MSMPITWPAPIRPSRCVKIRPIGPWPTTAHRWLITGPGAHHRPQHRGQRLGHDQRGQVGRIGGQPGQPRGLRADVLREAVVVVGMGQHERARLPAGGPRLDDRADVLVPQPARRAGMTGLAHRPSPRYGPMFVPHRATYLHCTSTSPSASARLRRVVEETSFRGPVNLIARMNPPRGGYSVGSFTATSVASGDRDLESAAPGLGLLGTQRLAFPGLPPLDPVLAVAQALNRQA